jgi:ABC-2 type transport system ATP-binding protein
VPLDGGRVVADGRAADLKRRVGGSRLDLVLRSADTAAAAVRTLSGAGLGPQVAEDGVTVGLPSDGSAMHVYHALDVLARAEIRVDAIAQHEPTLDDVFAALTGAGQR